MKIYDAHSAAKAFPPLKPPEMEKLKQSILTYGQRFPAWILDGKILDGRNRQEAIRQLVEEKKLKPTTELKVQPFSGDSVAGFVDAANDKRRHLTESQRAMVATKLLPLFRKETKERQAAAAKSTNRAKKKAQKSLTLTAPGRTAKTAAKQAAEAAGGKVSARSVERAEFVQKSDPTLAKKVFEGEMTVKQAERKIRLRGQVEAAKTLVLPVGQFPVIVADPPWEYDDELNGSLNRALPYPTMKLEEICALKIPAAAVCALFLWTTKSHLLDGSADRVLKAWGFTPRSMITWVKSNIGLGRYVRNRCEFVIIATRGTPVFFLEGDSTLKDDVIIQTGPRLSHSEKPAELFTRVEALCPATPRLEMFAREKERAGWVTSGSELAPALPAGDSADAGAAASIVDPVSAGHSQPAASGTSEGSERSDPDWKHVAAGVFEKKQESPPGKFYKYDRAGSIPVTPAVEADPPTGWDDVASYECTECHETFVSLDVLRKHAERHAPNNPSETPTPESVSAVPDDGINF